MINDLQSFFFQDLLQSSHGAVVGSLVAQNVAHGRLPASPRTLNKFLVNNGIYWYYF